MSVPATARVAKVSRILAGVLACGLLLAACRQATGPETGRDVSSAGQSEFRLVVILAIDQLRRDRLDAAMPGGLGRLAREGRIYRDATLGHARTETCPGHVSLVTGKHPGPSGVPGNRYIDRERLRSVYCVEDDGPSGIVLGSAGDAGPETGSPKGRSPKLITATALGDWLKDASPDSRVFSVSGKDRSAIAMGGQRADAAYWLDRGGSGRFTTSRYYTEVLPAWVEGWSAEALLAPVPAHWQHASGDPPNGTRDDDFVGEVARWSRTSPHPVKPHGDTAGSLLAFVATPYLDLRTLDFARQLVVEEGLGTGERVDLLAIGLSGTDYIGHLYGPWSQESRDALSRLDADLGRFVDFLEARLGAGRMLVVLSADHGVLPLPEWLAAHGEMCPVSGGRVPAQSMAMDLHAMLEAELGPGQGRWFVHEGLTLVFDPVRVAASGASMDRVIRLSADWLAAKPGVERTWTRAEIETADADDVRATLYRNSTSAGREADIEIEPASGCLFSDWPGGTSHGSPHAYDRDVPLVIMGRGIRPGVVGGAAGPVDVAPTLASHLGVSVPADLDGRVLPLGE